MRVNLITQLSNRPESGAGTIPISLTIRPACGLPGDYEYSMKSLFLLDSNSRPARRADNGCCRWP
jgi:hypothetical protein